MSSILSITLITTSAQIPSTAELTQLCLHPHILRMPSSAPYLSLQAMGPSRVPESSGVCKSVQRQQTPITYLILKRNILITGPASPNVHPYSNDIHGRLPEPSKRRELLKACEPCNKAGVTLPHERVSTWLPWVSYVSKFPGGAGPPISGPYYLIL